MPDHTNTHDQPCARCHRPHRGRISRGLCNSCYVTSHRNGTYRNYPRTTRPADDVLDDWDTLRRRGATREEAATHLGMRLESLERVIQRHRGDPRAQLGQKRRDKGYMA